MISNFCKDYVIQLIIDSQGVARGELFQIIPPLFAKLTVVCALIVFSNWVISTAEKVIFAEKDV